MNNGMTIRVALICLFGVVLIGCNAHEVGKKHIPELKKLDSLGLGVYVEGYKRFNSKTLIDRAREEFQQTTLDSCIQIAIQTATSPSIQHNGEIILFIVSQPSLEIGHFCIINTNLSPRQKHKWDRGLTKLVVKNDTLIFYNYNFWE